MDLSRLNLTVPDAATERVACEQFARSHAAPEYRERLPRLYDRWRAFNDEYFDGRLAVPHLSIGLTTPRRFCECRRTTDYGGEINVVLAERVVFGTDRRVVRAPYPDPGYVRFEDDLLLGATVKQFVLEERGTDEAGWGGYGPLYVAEANRIGATLGLPPVVARNRGFRGAKEPVAGSWPYAVRPDGYYGTAVRLDHLRIAGLNPRRPLRLATVPGAYEYFLYLLVTCRADRLQRLLVRLVDAEREVRNPALAARERAPHDASGNPVSVPVIDPAWLAWNGGCVRALAAGIRDRGAFDAMPILADALEDAECADPVLLDHCRARAEHTSNCWVLRLLTETP